MTPYSVLFPAFSDGLREPDPEFQREVTALEALGIPWRVINVDALIRGDLVKALRFFREAPPLPVIYRGWILHPEEYTAMYDELSSRGLRMLTSPAEYENALLFPKFFGSIEDYSLPAVWTTSRDSKEALDAARQLGPPPYFIKDYAKSAKQIWPNGCVAADEHALATAIEVLEAFRGDRFEGGIVIRPFVRLRYIDEHPFGGPIFEEYRLFFYRGTLISKSAYERIGGNHTMLPDYSFLPEMINSPFFTADVVIAETGEPYLLELGDGGSSALPPNISPLDFYTAISKVMSV